MAEKIVDLDHPFVSLYCGHCGHPLKFQISCGSRVCAKCRKKWFGYHYNAMLPLVARWKHTIALTLTIRNIPDSQFGRHDVKRIRDYFSKLRKKLPEILGGFYVVQATNYGSGWHLHLHVLYDGVYIPQQKVSRLWKEITADGSFIVFIRKVNEPKKAISYLLADFSGAPRIRTGDRETYDSVFKGSRLVQPFGCYRNTKFKVPFKCPDCGGTYWAFLEDLIGEKRRFHRDFGDDP